MPRVDVRVVRWTVILMAGASLAACASVTPAPRYPSRVADLGGAPPTAKGPSAYKTGEPYQVGGIWYVPHEQPDYDETGIASWYGPAFDQKATADGEIFDMNAISAAHTTLPLPSMVEVTNLENGRKLVVRVNDRGPFVGGRIIDLSHAAAQELGYAEKGLAKVRVRYVGPAPLGGPDVRMAQASPSRPAARYDAPVRLADATPMDRTEFGFHKPLPTRLPPGGAAVRAASAVAAAPLSTAPKPVDDDVILTSYKAPQPVGVSTIAELPPAKAPPRAGGKPAAPLTGADLGPPRSLRIETAQSAPSSAAPSSVVQGFRIQAGAFSSQDNAQRAVAQLSATGPATVEPFEKDGSTLYRVFVPGAEDEVAAYAIRDKVAAAGFADARVVKGF